MLCRPLVALLLPWPSMAVAAAASPLAPRHAFLAATPPSNGATPAPYPALEAAARRDFVQRCTVAMSVTNDALQPWKQVDAICNVTTLPFQCRQEVTERFKAVHERGSRMSPVCEAAYDWFQDHYGNLCPAQCWKVQCQTTCQWLEENRKLEQTEAALRAREKSQGEQDHEVRNLQQEVDKQRLATDALQREAATLEAQAMRANATLLKVQEQIDQALEKKERVHNKTWMLEAELQEIATDMSGAEQKVFEQGQSLDKLELVARFQQERLAGLEETALSLPALVEKQRQEVAEADERVQSLFDHLQMQLVPAVEAAELPIPSQEATVEQAIEALNVAERELKKGGREAAVKVLEDLVRQRREQLSEAQEELGKLRYKRDKAVLALNLGREEVEEAQDEADGRTAKLRAVEEKQASIHADISKEEAIVNRTMTEVASAQQSLVEEKSNLARCQEDANRTLHGLNIVRRAVAEYEAEAETARVSLRTARGSFALADFNRKAGEEKVKAAVHAQEVLIERLRAAEQHAGAARASLNNQLQAFQNASRDLHERRPAIVRQHGLGLLRLVGY
mmetsp:Transcript_135634/g.377756  ORF Transcript_135634/g.377756 Transcript_135634/m.377756 type:complete len:567 (+) Transcript_135634:163-1863(+)